MNKRQYSYSRLDLYDRCPHAYKTVYLDGIPRARHKARERGQILHGMVADYLNRLITLGLATDWDWARTAAPEGAIADVAEIWGRFYEGFVLPSGLEAPGVERRLAFDRIWRPVKFDSKRARFRMVLDFHFRQNGLGVIVDWKSSREVPQDVAKDLQLRTYAWGLKQALYQDIQEVLLRLHFLRYGKEREVLLMPQDLADVSDELDARINVIEKDKTFDPVPGSFCGMCGVTSHCPVMAQSLVPVEVAAPASREQAQKAASLLLTLQKMEKELASRLKEWVKGNGPIQVGDLVYGPKQSVSYDFDPKLVITALLETGLSREEVWSLLSLNKTNLERGLGKLNRKDLINLALSLGNVKTLEKIEFHKAKDTV
ncbi:MAG: PD-(D/E)XK nuclease family protein [Deltaproteobacteria bacterium]|nr:PD-(D/E)XK nuclease family protein [Deltaproteobacteria bacterium]